MESNGNVPLVSIEGAGKHEQVQIDPHAIIRFRERTGCKQDDEYIEKKLVSMVEQGKPAKFTKPKYELLALLNHHCQRANYILYYGILLVIVDEVVKTLHFNESERWEVIDVSQGSD